MNHFGYACETCVSFRIDMNCVLYPSRMKHKYDDLCEICEEWVNKNPHLKLGGEEQ